MTLLLIMGLVIVAAVLSAVVYEKWQKGQVDSAVAQVEADATKASAPKAS